MKSWKSLWAFGSAIALGTLAVGVLPVSASAETIRVELKELRDHVFDAGSEGTKIRLKKLIHNNNADVDLDQYRIRQVILRAKSKECVGYTELWIGDAATSGQSVDCDDGEHG